MSYAYDSQNMLKWTSSGITLHYDPLDRLIEYDTTVSTRFVHDGAEISTEVDNPAGAILRRYVRGDGADEVLVWYEGSGTGDRRFLSSDERGSVVSVTDASGALLAINSYDEYGIPGPGNVGRFQYTGQAWLPELGMYHYKARIYSPTLGRFLQTDPIGIAGGINLYGYVTNDPVNLVDPWGFVAHKAPITPCGRSLNGTCYEDVADDEGDIVVTGRRPFIMGNEATLAGAITTRPEVRQLSDGTIVVPGKRPKPAPPAPPKLRPGASITVVATQTTTSALCGKLANHLANGVAGEAAGAAVGAAVGYGMKLSRARASVIGAEIGAKSGARLGVYGAVAGLVVGIAVGYAVDYAQEKYCANK